MERTTGILLPIFSLPSNQGIGDFGKHTYRLIDALATQHIRIWQILPLNPTGFGNSPYQPFSSFAGDEIYIGVDKLAEYGLLKQSSIRNFNKFSEQVDYQGTREFKEPYFRKAFKNFIKNFHEFEKEYQMFVSQSEWLYPYAVFITLKKKNDGKPWQEWPKEQKNWIKDRKYSLKELETDIQYEEFLQFIFYKQWKEIKTYASSKNVEIMGDISFYVGLDSVDVWQHQDEFLLDSDGYPSFVAGVPPDYFSENGQRWGNPIYNWKKMKKQRYDFWMKRISWNAENYDIIRIDHFRAFDTYWKIPAECPNAKTGEWVTGPSYDFFDELYKQIPDVKIVVEDLGDLRKQVLKLRDSYHLSGMNVLQFELVPKLLKKPRKENIVLYTGTHDNDTIKGYYQDLPQNKKIALRRFFHNRGYDNRDFNELVIRYCLDSNAQVVVIPVQDVLGLGKEGRINTPSTIGGSNWKWKLKNLNRFYESLPQLGTWIQEANRGSE